MDKGDREWVYAGVGCVFAGALLSVLTGKHRWFAMGGVGGAALVAYRYYRGDRPQQQQSQSRPAQTGAPERLGAPEIPAVDVPNVGSPQPLARRDVSGYPVRFRVPDTEVHIDTMDDRIRPHFVGPLGPENDPVRYW